MRRRLRELVLSLRLNDSHRRAARLLIVLLAVPILMAPGCDNSASLQVLFFVAFLMIISPGSVVVPQGSGGMLILEAVQPGQRVTISCRYNRNSADAPNTVTVEYSPPSGASAITFAGRQPQNPASPPPYVFTAVPVDTNDALLVSYNAPQLIGGTGTSEQTIDSFTIRAGNDNYYQVIQQTLGQAAASAGPTVEALGARPSSPPAASAAAASDYYWFGSQAWLYTSGTSTLTTSSCTDFADFFQGGNFFIALEFPLGQRSDPSYVAPVRSSLNNAFLTQQGHPEYGYARVDLLDESKYPFTALFTLPLELRPEWMWYAANTLPQHSGRGWATMAPISTPTATCPGNLNLTDWEVRVFFPFDFGGSKNSCPDCVVNAYLCWAGSAEPEVLRDLFPAADVEPADASSWRDVQVTAAGPIPIRILGNPPNPPILLEGPSMAHIVPPAQVKLVNRISVISGTSAVSFKLATKSVQHLAWRLYRDTGSEAPDLTRPIAADDTLAVTSSLLVWALADVPKGVSGPETLTLTATSGGVSTSQADIVWIGGWPDLGRTVRKHMPRR
jgi:hypothetical protein